MRGNRGRHTGARPRLHPAMAHEAGIDFNCLIRLKDTDIANLRPGGKYAAKDL